MNLGELATARLLFSISTFDRLSELAADADGTGMGHRHLRRWARTTSSKGYNSQLQGFVASAFNSISKSGLQLRRSVRRIGSFPDSGAITGNVIYRSVAPLRERTRCLRGMYYVLASPSHFRVAGILRNTSNSMTLTARIDPPRSGR